MSYKDPVLQRAYQNDRMKRLRTQWFAENGPCRQCESGVDLEVDHIDATQKVSHRIWSWSQARRAVELAKCQPLCRKCHTEKHRSERKKPIVHGTSTAYRHNGCRCQDCCAANTARFRERRAAQKAA